jgi:NAD(P)-dependent dehydrogenase (short-subunit alcohol dehydrogenase family)
MTDPHVLEGRVALVTGSSQGLGAEIARTLSFQGAQVAILGRGAADAEATAIRITDETGVPARAYAGDVTDDAAVGDVVASIASDLGPVDILINNAGGFPAFKTTVETSPDEWRHLLDLNLTSAFLCMRATLPAMIERGYGRIVNIGSEAGRDPWMLNSVGYAASKAGLAGLTKHTAREVAGQGITINLVNPGTMLTRRNRELWADNPGGIEEVAHTIPVGRLGDPAEIAGLVAYLVGPLGGYTTGATFDVNGGRVMS